MKKLFLVVLLLFVGCNIAHSRKLAQRNLATYPWQFVTPMPHGRYGHDAVYASNGKIYVMGGLVYKVAKGFKKFKDLDSWMIYHYNDGRYSNLAYIPKTDQWEYMTSVPGRLSDCLTFYYSEEDKWIDKRVAIQNMKLEEKIKLYQPTEIKKKPTRIYETDLRRQGNGVALTNSIYNSVLWLGGQSFAADIEYTVLPYNVRTDAWPKITVMKMDAGSWLKTIYETSIPPMQVPRRDHRAVTTSEGKTFVLGGWHEGKATNKWGSIYNTGENIVLKTMECYDPKTNKWGYKKSLSRERMSFAAVAGKDKKIYVFGGAAGMETDPKTPILNTVEVYDPEIDSWSFRKPMPVKRSGHYAVLAADGKIYMLGGSEVPDAPLNTVFIYDPERDTWEKGPDMILPRDVLAAVATPDGKIYAIGGTDVGAYENKAIWKHLAELVPKDELGDYTGKVQDTVEVLDIYKWRKSEKKK